MTDNTPPPHDREDSDNLKRGAADISETQSWNRPLMVESPLIKHAEDGSDTDSSWPIGLWIGAGVLVVLAAGAWLIWSGVI